ncbi:hypothetical protein MS3_00002242 [Schistosoma haematobium]|uniref:Letm1 RBD domain-containing protein n=1 Tax=Schistosoma haematobium TaxID=6185 RepID=A0A922LZ44_SCHHA|nr:hypothetical protein MS3_00002242 [Schistosoma haematobium]KAH9596621.1 hypothetical protein MS3_00002242 [Schistosoma haematobium]CAH8488672.1 unnamed protein product [Schistosoma haematobium]CAH8489938.1 unnamed protein product [Schistosoma haematobium]
MSIFKRYITKTVVAIVKKYTKLVTYLENKWEGKHASSFHNYKLFKNGVHSTLIDLGDLSQLWIDITCRSQSIIEILPTLSRHQVYVLRQVPKDLVRILPVMLLAPLPGTILILPIFFAFPRIFLSRAFWTLEQCKSIDTKCLKDRFNYNTQSLLKSKLLTIIYSSPCSMNYSQPILKSLRKLASALSQVSILEPISIEQIRDLVPAFKGPLSLEQLDTSHLAALCRLHGLSIYSYIWMMNTLLWSDLFKRKSILKTSRILVLKKHAYFLYVEDQCMQKDKLFNDNSLSILQNSELKQLCLLRGINPYLLNHKDLEEKLQYWISASTVASETDFSFRLHLPLLLCSNNIDINNNNSIDKY